jgi:hypothetical protein
MANTVNKVEVWRAEMDDRAGGLADKLAPLEGAGVDLLFLIARRTSIPGKGIVYLSGVKGAKATKAAAAAGFQKTTELSAVRLEAPNKAGACARLLRKLGDAGINVRGVSASTVGGKYSMIVALDTADDADKAAKLLRSG